jgi:hypothetical protein
MKSLLILLAVIVLAVVAALLLVHKRAPITDHAELSAADFPSATADVFKAMDGGIALTPDEVEGRDDWILWSAGNQQFWDEMARHSYGLADLLKTLDSRKRPVRFAEMGLINEPGFKQAAKPDEYGLWLDEGPQQDGIDAKVYGRSTGVIGFRLFPNPDFDDAARKRWDPARFYDDPSYYYDPHLVRPYRVGMTCGLCHVSPHPLNPPADPANPAWENLASVIGNQYFREGKVFGFDLKPGSFLWEVLNAQPPGTSDTSRVANDHINNPNAINAIFNVAARLDATHEERIAGGALNTPGEPSGDVRKVPHILKDGADSVGVPGATIRVYVNEGLFSQYWLSRHDILVGLTPQKPFEIAKARQDSVYWRATEARLANIVKFFMRIKPYHLEDAPGGKQLISSDDAVMKRGKAVFADNCAECHSSKQPPASIPASSPEWAKWMEDEVQKPDFRENNFFSNEQRYPVTKLKTNACRALGTNATRGHIWDNFSSETYKTLPAVGDIECYNPWDGSTFTFAAPGGGPGYYRPPSLIAIWSSAPFLHNNSVGTFSGDPSVAGRVRDFEDACAKLLWPEKRAGKDSIWRTTQESWLTLPKATLPALLKPLCDGDELKLGPIPKGTPINLLANIDPESGAVDLAKLVLKLKKTLIEIKLKHLDEQATSELMTRELVPDLLKVSKCPDFIEDKGHTFGADLPDDDKRALIEFLKTL